MVFLDEDYDRFKVLLDKVNNQERSFVQEMEEMLDTESDMRYDRDELLDVVEIFDATLINSFFD